MSGAAPAAGVARAPAGEVWHFSEDPGITEFVPHVAATARQPEAFVWAVDGDRCPDYWFPRQCPRAMAWRTPGSGPEVGDRLLGGGVQRVHGIEYPWLRALTTTTVHAYPFAAEQFRPFGDPPHAYVSEQLVRPLRPPLPVTDLVEQHERAGIQLRVVTDLFSWWAEVVPSGLGFSGIRLRNSPNVREV
ncbi:DUF6886 family protein [Auraticoccus monumenti]|uniref:Uncharacterized protein n=1 Tax=Auraticoccus monumenti TaxID=675864 RepID=A0A1G7B3J5_9ACTN|nr:DUF6886 family protein [Auraticoccus monumenti]SDE21522.1 hypothetical protein SAMN04489747_2827 [Auraticoccus monumenti]